MGRWILLFALLILVGLTACLPGDDDPTAQEIDQNTFNQQTRRALIATQTAVLTFAPSSVAPTLTPRPIVPTLPPRTATPDIDRTGIISQTFRSGPWQTGSFTPVSGTATSLRDPQFDGRLVIVHTFSTTCGFCLDQLTELKQAVTRLTESGNAEKLSIVMLNIDGLDTPETVATFIEEQAIPEDWTVGVATQDLSRNLRDTFGSTYVDPNIGGVFLIDLSGFGQIPEFSMNGYDELESAVLSLLATEPTEIPPAS